MAGLNDDIDRSDYPELNGPNAGDIQPRDFATPDASVAQDNPAQPPAPAQSFLARFGDAPTEEDKVPTIDDIFGPDIVPNEIPNLDMKVVLIGEKQNTIDDTEAVAKNIVLQNSISQEDMVAANAAMPGILDENHVIGLYTEQPSQIGYSDAVKRISDKLNETRRSQVDVSQEALEGALVACRTTLEYVDDSFSTKFEMRARYAARVVEQIEESKLAPSVNPNHVSGMAFFTTVISDVPAALIAPSINEAFDALIVEIQKSRSYSVYLYSGAYQNGFISPAGLAEVFESQMVCDNPIPVSVYDLVAMISSKHRDYLCEALRDTIKQVQANLETRRSLSYNRTDGIYSAVKQRAELLSQSCETLKRVLDFTSGMNRVENLLLDKVTSAIFEYVNSIPAINPDAHEVTL